jgi:hypothetical protein
MATIAEFFDWLLVQHDDVEDRFYEEPGSVIDEFEKQYGSLDSRAAVESRDIREIRQAMIGELEVGTRAADSVVIRARMG